MGNKIERSRRNNQPQMGDQIQNFKDALRNGNLQEVENLLRKGVDPSADNNYGISMKYK